MAALADDPFDTVRAQVTSTLSNAERHHAKWGEARRRKPVRHDECKLLLSELNRMLDSLDADLTDLDAVVCLIERDRPRFPQLDDAEVNSRRAFVRSSIRAMQSIREDLSTHVPSKAALGGKHGATPEREGLLAAPSASPARTTNVAGSSVSGRMPHQDREMPPISEDDVRGSGNGAFFGQHTSLQQTQLEQQDEVLDVLHGAVGRLKNLGNEMNDELSVHARMLGDIENQVDNASNAMASLKSKMKEMASSKDRGKFCAIIVLSCVLFGLTFLVVYT
jgi:hypothetical protein